MPHGPSGKLLCPGCGGKLGAWDWSGIRCACGVWVAPGIQIAKSRLDVSKSKAQRTKADPAAQAGVSIHWLRTQPPPCVVVVAGLMDADDVKAAIATRWAGRHVKDGRAAWLFVGSHGLGHLEALLTYLRTDCGVVHVACGGIGDDAARSAISAANAADVTAVFALAVDDSFLASDTDNDVASSWRSRSLTNAIHRGASALVVIASSCAATPHHPPTTSEKLTVTQFPRVDPGVLNDGVVRTLCTWLSTAVPGVVVVPKE